MLVHTLVVKMTRNDKYCQEANNKYNKTPSMIENMFFFHLLSDNPCVSVLQLYKCFTTGDKLSTELDGIHIPPMSDAQVSLALFQFPFSARYITAFHSCTSLQ